ncbi:hypothetical protein LH128_17012 [Sphingomonas sp. LH128]|uniref:hypothetical protein n=1 Tax=Sphingomonas sp. LH128 TaxID=473781 RepID=UPI00027CC9F0|nr:hypothetical protein [Sphingomonas sp. LH128]EJU11796.1 hypothetical protein LH128_17012 [Sphingomonas sp. LH128]
MNRFSVSRTVVGLAPTSLATDRVESLASRLSLRISRTWRITTLLVGIQSSWLLSQRTGPNDQASRHHKLRAIKSERCAGNARNAARDHLGMLRAIKSE